MTTQKVLLWGLWLNLVFLFLLNVLATGVPQAWTAITQKGLGPTQSGVGSVGVFDTPNRPPALMQGRAVSDSMGNGWVFGGTGYIATTANAKSNQLWAFRASDGKWAFMSGDNIANAPGVYVAVGLDTGKPSGRNNPQFWSDGLDRLWLFGGFGKNNAGIDKALGDFWMYTISTNKWTYIGGCPEGACAGVTYALKKPSLTAFPFARQNGQVWTDDKGKLWLFGGKNSVGIYNDLWMYDPLGGVWTMMGGTNTADVLGVYTTLGTVGGGYPGARVRACTASDKEGRLWMYGGEGKRKTTVGTLGDLWYYDTNLLDWVWVAGPDDAAAVPNFNGGNTFTPGGNPASKKECAMWFSKDWGDIYVFGGSDGSNFWNDLWRYNVYKGSWFFLGGSQTSLHPTTYPNDLGARAEAMFWVEDGQKLHVYGGTGKSTSGPTELLDDHWGYSVPYHCDPGCKYGYCANAGTGCNCYTGFHTVDCGTIDVTQSVSCDTAKGAALASPDLCVCTDLFYGASCSTPVTASWKWIGGSLLKVAPGTSNSIVVPGAFTNLLSSPITGTEGAGIFGARAFHSIAKESASTTFDAFYVFGGQNKNGDLYNDLWLLDFQSGFTQRSAGGPASFGTEGTYSSSNKISVRHSACVWYYGGFVFVFGGNGKDSTASVGHLGDLWAFKESTGEWALLKGPTTKDTSASFTGGSVHPGGVEGAFCWLDRPNSSELNLWVYGGKSINGNNANLFRYKLSGTGDMVDGNWIFAKGPMANGDYKGHSVTDGEAAKENSPPSRALGLSFTDSQNRFWLFGGWGTMLDGTMNTFNNDVWMYEASRNEWTFITGCKAVSNECKAGKFTSPVFPGGRKYALGSMQSNGVFTVIAGEGYVGSTGTIGFHADTWKFNIWDRAWTFVRGPQVAVAGGGSPLLEYPPIDKFVPSTDLTHRYAGISMYLVKGPKYKQTTVVIGGDSFSKSNAVQESLNDMWQFVEPTCSVNCFQGHCPSSPNTCVCFSGWTGSDCNTFTCSPACVSGQGTCSGPNFCQCNTGFSGSTCSVTDIVGFSFYGNQGFDAAAVAPSSPGTATDGTYHPSGLVGSAMCLGDNTFVFGGENAAGTTYHSGIWFLDTEFATPQWGLRTTEASSGVWGSLGIESSSGQISPRAYSAMICTSSKLYIFGGYGKDSAANVGYLSDTWSLNFANGYFTWVSGDNTKNSAPVKGASGVFDSSHHPGGRSHFASWVDSTSGKWFIFGGEGDVAGSTVYMHDVWAFDTATGKWAWLAGDNTVTTGSYGTPGVGDASVIPAARSGASASLYNGKAFLFGGRGKLTTAGSMIYYNDLFYFDVGTKFFTYVKGGSSSTDSTSTEQMPVPRAGAAIFENQGVLYIYGGVTTVGGVDSSGGSYPNPFYLSDLWRYSISSTGYAYVKGQFTGNNDVSYTTSGTVVSTNWPGTRAFMAYATEVESGEPSHFIMFGGISFQETSLNPGGSGQTKGSRADIWKYDSGTEANINAPSTGPKLTSLEFQQNEYPDKLQFAFDGDVNLPSSQSFTISGLQISLVKTGGVIDKTINLGTFQASLVSGSTTKLHIYQLNAVASANLRTQFGSVGSDVTPYISFSTGMFTSTSGSSVDGETNYGLESGETYRYTRDTVPPKLTSWSIDLSTNIVTWNFAEPILLNFNAKGSYLMDGTTQTTSSIIVELDSPCDTKGRSGCTVNTASDTSTLSCKDTTCLSISGTIPSSILDVLFTASGVISVPDWYMEFASGAFRDAFGNQMSSSIQKASSHTLGNICRKPQFSIKGSQSVQSTGTVIGNFVLGSVDCTGGTAIKVEWKLKTTDGNIVSEAALFNFQFALPGTLTGKLNLECKASYAHDPSIFDTRSLVVDVVSADLSAIISGGFGKEASALFAFDLDGSQSSDPNNAAAILGYKWGCELATTGATCGIDSILLPEKSISIPANTFAGGTEVKFSLTVTSGALSASTAQKVFFTSSSSQQLKVQIQSPDIRGTSVNPTNDIRLEGVCLTCSSTSTGISQAAQSSIRYSWSQVSGTGTLNLQDQNIAPTGVNQRFLKINAGSLTEGSTYVLQLEVGEGFNTGLTQITLSTNQPPRNGTCTVSPASGEASVTKFTIECKDWVDDPFDDPFTYAYQFISGTSRTPLKFTAESTFTTLLPAPASTGGDSFIVVDIGDVNGAVNFYRIPTPISLTKPAITNEADFFGAQLQSNSELQVFASTGDVTGTAGRISVYAGVLNEQGTTTDTTVKKNRKQYRLEYVNLVNSVVSNPEANLDESELDMVSSSLETITLKPEEVDTSAQLAATETMQNLLTSSKKKGKVTQNFTKSAVSTIDNVFRAVNLQNLGGDGASNGTTSTNISLSAGANKEHTKNVTSSLISSLKQLSSLVISGLVQGEPPQVITTDTIEFVTVRSDPSALESIVQGNAGVALPTKGFFASIVTNQSESVDTQLTIVKQNMYTWSTSASSITSGNVIFEASAGGTVLKVQNLTSDIEIKIPSGSTETDTTITLSNAAEQSKYAVIGITPSDPTNYVIVNISVSDTNPLGFFASSTETRPNAALSDFSAEVSSITNSSWLLPPLGTSNGTWNVAINNPHAVNISYAIKYLEVNCKFWDETNEFWSTDGCKISVKSDFSARYCLCNHLTSFGSGSFVAPNAVNIAGDAALFADILANPLVLTVIIVIYSIFAVLLYYARKNDKKDVLKIFPVPLKDNRKEDKYMYEISLKTGVYPGSGTDARVYIRIFGEMSESGPRELHRCGWVDNFYSNAVDKFMLNHPVDFGEIRFIEVWHDNSGVSPGWYLANVAIKNIRTGQKWQFINEGWLDEDEDEGAIDVTLEPATPSELFAWSNVFRKKSANEFMDGHLWVSVFTRPIQSTFSRVQRLLCLMNFIISSMTVSALWYDTTDPSEDPILLGITLQDIYVGIVAALMVFPVNLLIIQIFRHTRSTTRVKEKERLMKELKQEALKEQYGLGGRSTFNIAVGLIGGAGLGGMFGGARGGNKVMPFFGGAQLTEEEEEDSLEPKPLAKKKSSSKPEENGEKGRNKLMLEDSSKKYSGPLTVDHTTAKDDTSDPKWPSRPGKDNSVVDMECAENVTLNGLEGYEEDPIDNYVNSLEKKQRKLPPWVNWIAYVLIFFICAFGTYVILLLGLKFGTSKSSAWLRTFFMGVVQSAIITQPLKIFVLTMLLTFVCRKKQLAEIEGDDDEDQSMYEFTVPTVNEKTGEVIHVNHTPKPAMDRETIGNARRIKMITRTIIYYLLFIILVSVIMYGELDENSYHSKKDIEEIFLNTKFDIGVNSSIAFMDIYNTTHFYFWATQVLIPGLYLETLPNSVSLKTNELGYLADYSNYLLGKARFRQLRVKNDTCDVPDTMSPYINRCRSSLSEGDQEKDPYGPAGNWTWNDGTNAIPFWGYDEHYSGSGYVVNLDNLQVNATSIVRYLGANNWIDTQTRFVTTEFNVYNANTNLFVVCRFALEFMSAGGVNPSYSIWPAKLFRYRTAFDWVLLFLECVLAIILIRLAYLQRKVVHKAGGFFKYIKIFWNVLEVAIIFFGLVSICLYFNRAVVVRLLASEIEDDAENFHKYQNAAAWDTTARFAMCFTGFLVYLKLLKLISFNARIAQNMLHMRKTMRVMTGFCFMFLVVFLCFVQWGYISFHTNVSQFRTYGESMFGMFQTSLGRFDYRTLDTNYPFLGPLIFFSFTLFMIIILSVFFAALLVNSAPTKREKQTMVERQYEVLNYLAFKMGKMVGKSVKMKKHGPAPIPFEKTHQSLLARLDEVDQMLDMIEFEQQNTPEETPSFQRKQLPTSGAVRDEQMQMIKNSKGKGSSSNSILLEHEHTSPPKQRKGSSFVAQELNLPNFIPD
eukprot:Nk52_evm34s2340 gene=Nk52_evmTU34s2340